MPSSRDKLEAGRRQTLLQSAHVSGRGQAVLGAAQHQRRAANLHKSIPVVDVAAGHKVPVQHLWGHLGELSGADQPGLRRRLGPIAGLDDPLSGLCRVGRELLEQCGSYKEARAGR